MEKTPLGAAPLFRDRRPTVLRSIRDSRGIYKCLGTTLSPREDRSTRAACVRCHRFAVGACRARKRLGSGPWPRPVGSAGLRRAARGDCRGHGCISCPLFHRRQHGCCDGVCQRPTRYPNADRRFVSATSMYRASPSPWHWRFSCSFSTRGAGLLCGWRCRWLVPWPSSPSSRSSDSDSVRSSWPTRPALVTRLSTTS